ncbi:MAG: DoxX family protein [Planctomycetaceae bacterium]
MHAVRGFLSLLARLMIVAIFLSAIGGKVMAYQKVVEDMAAQGVPSPKILLGGAIAFLILGSLSIVLGFWGRFGALLLLIFLAAATYYFHDFWKLPPDTDPAVQRVEVINCFKNVALMGTMLFLIANGTGPWSLDNRGGTAAPTAADDE